MFEHLEFALNQNYLHICRTFTVDVSIDIISQNSYEFDKFDKHGNFFTLKGKLKLSCLILQLRKISRKLPADAEYH